jgi:sn-glycerol 3-phosphate transport system ATP-binding protein
MIAGLDSPTSGRVYIGGRDVTALPPAQRKISMVFQNYALFPHLSVRENILFGLKVRKEPRSEFEPRLAKVAELLGLGPLLERKPSQLSGGQQQRVALGRAVISQAPVCLMDEPLSNLDAQLRHEMRREIRALQRQLGITMVYVTHDQTEAMSMADRVVLLNAGRIEQNDTPGDLYGYPKTTFAARFIGTPPMNLLALDADTRALLQAHGRQAVPAAAEWLGVRPEHISLRAGAVPENRAMAAASTARRETALESQGGGVIETAAQIESLEYFGADSIVICRVGDNRGVAVRASGHLRSQPGEHTTLSWHPHQQHFFDASGKAIGQPAIAH